MRWDPGFLCSGSDFRSFWTELAAESKVTRCGLFIAGRGIDPRTTVGPAAITQTGFPVTKCCLIRLTNPFDSPDRPRSQDAADNEEKVRVLFEPAEVELQEIAVRNSNGQIVGSYGIRTLLSDWNWLDGFTDLIVDITALPTSVSFPLLGTLISIYDERSSNGLSTFNLHCIVCENADLDKHVVAEGGDAAEYVEPFRGRGGLAAESDPTVIWTPVLGEGKNTELRKIYEMLSPQEVKPFLPSPSLDPRRGDKLVSNYYSMLFDSWEVDPRGFLYADERDPFDIYRQLGELAADYERSLKPLGSTNTVVSVHSSKLLSLGALLAAFEHKLGVAHVEPTEYTLDETLMDSTANEMFEVWLTGDAYVEA